MRAIAIAENPTLFKRGRGQLRWESDIPEEERTRITHVGDEQALKVFIAEHGVEFKAKLEARRHKAKVAVDTLNDRRTFQQCGIGLIGWIRTPTVSEITLQTQPPLDEPCRNDWWPSLNL